MRGHAKVAELYPGKDAPLPKRIELAADSCPLDIREGAAFFFVFLFFFFFSFCFFFCSCVRSSWRCRRIRGSSSGSRRELGHGNAGFRTLKIENARRRVSSEFEVACQTGPMRSWAGRNSRRGNSSGVSWEGTARQRISPKSARVLSAASAARMRGHWLRVCHYPEASRRSGPAACFPNQPFKDITSIYHLRGRGRGLADCLFDGAVFEMKIHAMDRCSSKTYVTPTRETVAVAVPKGRDQAKCGTVRLRGVQRNRLDVFVSRRRGVSRPTRSPATAPFKIGLGMG